MAGYIFKQFRHGASVGSAVPNDTFNLVTVPAGHIYLIKKGVLRYNKGAGGAVTLRMFLTDTAGANPRPVNALASSGAPAENGMINLCGQDSPANVAPTDTVPTLGVSLENIVMEAGQILQLTTTAGGAVAITTQSIISGVDYTI